MGKIKVTKDCNGIQGLMVIEPTVFGDDRGYFMETYNYNDFAEAGIDCQFVQDNQSASILSTIKRYTFLISVSQVNCFTYARPSALRFSSSSLCFR